MQKLVIENSGFEMRSPKQGKHLPTCRNNMPSRISDPQLTKLSKNCGI